MNVQTEIGHNNPPNPIDEAIAPFDGAISEAENWLDGSEVETEDQMKCVDELTKEIKAALKAVNAGEKSAAAPLHDAWKAEKALWKPTIDDLVRIRDGLVSVNSAFKKKLAAEKAAQERAAWDAANAAKLEAEKQAAEARTGDIEAQRSADAARQAALEAEKEAQKQNKDVVKGMRKVTKFEIQGHRDALHWIAANDKPAMTAFIEDYVRRNFKARAISGVRVWEEKEAF